jgi:PhnB protein
VTKITIHMIVAGADRASAWYRDVFGAAEHDRITLPDGRLIHVELHLDGSVLMLADEFPEHGAVGPASGGFSRAVAFYLDCADVDAVWRKALAAGDTEHRPLMDTPFGDRDGQIIDPFGYRWGLTQHLRDVSHDEMAQAAAQMFGQA